MAAKSLSVVIILTLVGAGLASMMFLPETSASGNEIYVHNAWYATRDGTAEHPYAGIQYAIDLAEDGDTIIEGINTMIELFLEGFVVLSQDWHPQNHLSFADNHPGKNPGDEFTSKGIGPVLWPAHCVQHTYGAKFHKKLNTKLINKIFQKGMNPEIDSYSAFIDNDKKTETGLREYLRGEKIERIFVCGLALDYCCYNTAIDGVSYDFDVYFLIDLTKGVDLPPGNISKSLDDMVKKGVRFAILKSFIY